MKNRIWNKLDQKAWSNTKKQRSFLVCYMLFCAFCGAVAWFLAGQWLIPTAAGFVCFMGYPCFFVGFLDGVIYLYRQ